MSSFQTIYSSLAVVELIKYCQFKPSIRVYISSSRTNKMLSVQKNIFKFRISRTNKKLSVQNLFKSHSSIAKKKLSKNCQS